MSNPYMAAAFTNQDNEGLLVIATIYQQFMNKQIVPHNPDEFKESCKYVFNFINAPGLGKIVINSVSDAFMKYSNNEMSYKDLQSEMMKDLVNFLNTYDEK
jgi:hypothetical protein